MRTKNSSHPGSAPKSSEVRGEGTAWKTEYGQQLVPGTPSFVGAPGRLEEAEGKNQGYSQERPTPIIPVLERYRQEDR